MTDGDREEEMMGINSIKGSLQGTSLAVQWLELHASNAGGSGSIPGGEAKIPHELKPQNQQNIKGPLQHKIQVVLSQMSISLH